MSTEVVRTIRLAGKMGVLFGKFHRLAVANAAEAVRALCVLKPGFEQFLMESRDNGFDFAVIVGNKSVAADELKNPIGSDEIKFVPIMHGSKEGTLQVIAGVVLIAIGVVVQYALGGAPNPISNYLYGAGISMIVGGIIQLLSPQPKKTESSDKGDDRQSYVFNGPVNTQAQGNPVPLLYGKMFAGSAVVSAGISIQDNYIVPSGNTGLGSGGSGGGGFGGDFAGFYTA